MIVMMPSQINVEHIVWRFAERYQGDLDFREIELLSKHMNYSDLFSCAAM
jgi:hypothetical protein